MSLPTAQARAAGRDRDPDPARRVRHAAPGVPRLHHRDPSRASRSTLPPLGAARLDPGGGEGVAGLGRVDLDAMPLPDKVGAVIAAMLKATPENLPVDTDGDIGIRSGSAMVFVRVRDNPPLVDVFSPVLTEVNANEQLYLKLSELTHRMPIGRLYCTGADGVGVGAGVRPGLPGRPT